MFDLCNVEVLLDGRTEAAAQAERLTVGGCSHQEEHQRDLQEKILTCLNLLVASTVSLSRYLEGLHVHVVFESTLTAAWHGRRKHPGNQTFGRKVCLKSYVWTLIAKPLTFRPETT